MGYGRIIYNLTKLRNITWAKIVDAVLLTVTKDETQTVKSLTGAVRIALSVVKYPFITHLSLFEAKDNLSTLEAVSAFTPVDCDSDIVKLARVLHGIGPTLKQFDLSNVINLSIREVTKCCAHLEILSLYFVNLLSRETNPSIPSCHTSKTSLR
jgi:hypothetical protein